MMQMIVIIIEKIERKTSTLRQIKQSTAFGRTRIFLGGWENDKSPFQGSLLMSMCFNVLGGVYGLRQKLCIDDEPSIQTDFSPINSNQLLVHRPQPKPCE